MTKVRKGIICVLLVCLLSLPLTSLATEAGFKVKSDGDHRRTDAENALVIGGVIIGFWLAYHYSEKQEAQKTEKTQEKTP